MRAVSRLRWAVVLCALGLVTPALAATSSAQLWTALAGRLTCGVAIHPPNSPPMQLLCSARVVPGSKGERRRRSGLRVSRVDRPSLRGTAQPGLVRRHTAERTRKWAQLGDRPDQRHVQDQRSRGSLREPGAPRLHDHGPLLPRVLSAPAPVAVGQTAATKQHLRCRRPRSRRPLRPCP